jgi:hypothetical protein
MRHAAAARRQPSSLRVIIAGKVWESDMEGLKLLGTFFAMALVSVAVGVAAGLVVDNLPAVHDLFSVLVFFGTTLVMLVIAWPLAVRLTAPRQTTRA